MKACFSSFFLLFFFAIASAFAQQPVLKETTAPPALTRQFQGLKERSNSYRERETDYKVVSVNALDSFWKSVQQALKDSEKGLIEGKLAAEQELLVAQQTIAEQQAQLETLQQDNATKDQQVQQNLQAVNNLSVLGVSIPKHFYVILTAAIILALVVLLLIGVQQYKGSKRIAVEKQDAYLTMEQELNECKKKAREREIKIKRDLQTEMNLREELTLELEKLRKQQV